MKAVFGILVTYALAGLCGLALYILSFRLPIGGEIVFYRGLVLALIVAAVLLGGMLVAARRVTTVAEYCEMRLF